MDIRFNNVRISFPVLDQPQTIPGVADSKPAWGSTFILQPESTAQVRTPEGKWSEARPAEVVIKEVLGAVAKDAWKENMAAVVEQARMKDKICYRSGPRIDKTGAVMPGFENGKWISARAEQGRDVKPLILDGAKNVLQQAVGVIYSGCRVNTLLSIFAYKKGSIGLGANLAAVQFYADDKALGGSRAAQADDFEPVAGATSAEAGSPAASVFD